MVTTSNAKGQTIVVLSMSDLQNYQRCRKLFELSAIRHFNPSSVKGDAVQRGLEFHSIVAHYDKTATWPSSGVTNEMLQVAKDYVQYIGGEMPKGHVISIEHPLFVYVGEFGNRLVYVRMTPDRMWVSKDKTVKIRDYKTFGRAPTLDTDRDFQAKTYLVLAALHLRNASDNKANAPKYRFEFEWHHVRNEAGRMLKRGNDMVWTPWPDDERYLFHSMILSDDEARIFYGELVDCVWDVLNTIDTKRFYRTALKGNSPYTCGSCFQRNLCLAEVEDGGTLSDANIAHFTEPPDARYDFSDVTADPRVVQLVNSGSASDVESAVREVYGNEVDYGS